MTSISHVKQFQEKEEETKKRGSDTKQQRCKLSSVRDRSRLSWCHDHTSTDHDQSLRKLQKNTSETT